MGLISDIVGSITGKTAAKELRKGKAATDKLLDDSYNTGVVPAYNEAYQLYDPYKQQGDAAQKMLMDSLGVNGTEAQGAVLAQYEGANPFRQFNINRGVQAVNRAKNAGGNAWSGAAALAGNRVAQERGSQDLQQWRENLMAGGQTGFNATSAQAGIKAGMGNNAWAYGTTKAGVQQNHSNAMAQNSNTLANNLLGIAGMGLKASGVGGYGAK